MSLFGHRHSLPGGNLCRNSKSRSSNGCLYSVLFFQVNWRCTRNACDVQMSGELLRGMHRLRIYAATWSAPFRVCSRAVIATT